MSNRNENMFLLVLIHQHGLAPLLARFPEKTDRLPLHPQLPSKVLLDLTLVQSVDIEERLRAAYRRQVHQDSQMTCVSALVLMEDPISIDEDHLWPEMRLICLQSFEELQRRRQFPKGQKPWHVFLCQFHIQIVLVDNLPHLDTIDDQACTSPVLIPP